jgi:hypothetical protein
MSSPDDWIRRASSVRGRVTLREPRDDQCDRPFQPREAFLGQNGHDAFRQMAAVSLRVPLSTVDLETRPASLSSQPVHDCGRFRFHTMKVHAIHAQEDTSNRETQIRAPLIDNRSLTNTCCREVLKDVGDVVISERIQSLPSCSLSRFTGSRGNTVKPPLCKGMFLISFPGA